MNKGQRFVLLIGVLFTTTLLMYPPWVESFDNPPYIRERPLGYSWIFCAPHEEERWSDPAQNSSNDNSQKHTGFTDYLGGVDPPIPIPYGASVNIDKTRLSAGLLAAFIMFGGIILATRTNKIP
jgi:hypothetical protein